MTNRIKLEVSTRRTALALAFVACGCLMVSAALSRQEDDGERKLWNKQFDEARAKAKAKPAAPNKSKPAQAAPAAESEMLGVTVWRLRAGAPEDGTPRLLVRKNDGASDAFQLERTSSDTSFRQNELVRLSVETTRADDSFLYVIDRELFKGGKLGEPELIFPGATTPTNGNLISVGQVLSVPAAGDPIPHFTLRRSRPDHIGEQLTIIVSKERLPMLGLNAEWLAQHKREWGGTVERRESRQGVGQVWTAAEQEAESGARKLTQGDPLPQTLFRVKAKPGKPVMVTMPLHIAP